MRLLYDRNKAAIIYKDREYSYKELLTGIKYYSTLLNIKKDSKVVVYVENRPEIIQSFFSIWEKQGIAIVLDAGYTPEQLLYVFNDAEPEYIYVTNKNYKNAVAAKEMYGKSLEIINIDDIVVPKEFQPDNYELNVDNVEDTAVTLYTSGTTGNPKGVISATQWTAVSDLSNREFYYKTMDNSQIRKIDLKKIDFSSVKYQAFPMDNEKDNFLEINIK